MNAMLLLSSFPMLSTPQDPSHYLQCAELFSPQLTKTIVHRHARGAILQLILDSAKLRSNINCDNLLVRGLGVSIR